MAQSRKRYDRQFKISAAQVVLSGDMRVVDLAKELGIKDSTLRRWAQEYEEMGESAFPGNGSPKVNKDFEIVKLRKKVEDPEREMSKTEYYIAPISPGELLKEEFLEPMRISHYRLAKEIIVPAGRIGQIVANKRSIPPTLTCACASSSGWRTVTGCAHRQHTTPRSLNESSKTS